MFIVLFVCVCGCVCVCCAILYTEYYAVCVISALYAALCVVSGASKTHVLRNVVPYLIVL